MTDAGAWRHDAKILERVLAPAQEDVALLVSLEFEIGVDEERRLRSVLVDLHRVVDDEIDRLKRIDALRVSAECGERIAHRGEVDDGRHAGEVLQQHSARAKRDFSFLLALHVPRRERFDVPRLTNASSSLRSRFSRRILRLKGRVAARLPGS